MKYRFLFYALTLLLSILVFLPASAHTIPSEEEILKRIGVDEKPGGQVPLDLSFNNQEVTKVPVKHYFTGGPVILTPDGRVARIAGQVDSVFLFITLIGLIFFVITQGFLIYFAVKYRRKKREEPGETPYSTGNHWLEAVWVVIPSLVVLAIFIYGYVVFRDIRTLPAKTISGSRSSTPVQGCTRLSTDHIHLYRGVEG
ncbi:MAG: cytochrome c oxidase subunit II transmembrane domain-containing protein [Geobacteraceae bacterium]